MNDPALDRILPSATDPYPREALLEDDTGEIYIALEGPDAARVEVDGVALYTWRRPEGAGPFAAPFDLDLVDQADAALDRPSLRVVVVGLLNQARPELKPRACPFAQGRVARDFLVLPLCALRPSQRRAPALAASLEAGE